MKFKTILAIAFATILLATNACKKEETTTVTPTPVEVDQIPSTYKLIGETYILGAAAKAKVYSEKDLFVGYNKIFVAMYDSVSNSRLTTGHFDVIPMNHSPNFFEEWDLSKGICVIEQNDKIVHHVEASQSIRSPTAKYYNCQAMLLDGGYFPDNDVINTGIIGASAEHIKQLDCLTYNSNNLNYSVFSQGKGNLWLQRFIHEYLTNNAFLSEEQTDPTQFGGSVGVKK